MLSRDYLAATLPKTVTAIQTISELFMAAGLATVTLKSKEKFHG